MSVPAPSTQCTAFAGTDKIASGDARTVASVVKAAIDADPTASILVFDDTTAEPVEFDLRGTIEDVLSRLPERAAANEAAPEGPRPPGRPRLGVVAREVTLLPRHWDWLASQPGGASVTLRKLVERARRESGDDDRVRIARDATYRFMLVLAGNEPGFEDATRALWAGERGRFGELIAGWPADVREYATTLSAGCW